MAGAKWGRFGAFSLGVGFPADHEICHVRQTVATIGTSALVPDRIGSEMRRNGLMPEVKIITRAIPQHWCQEGCRWKLFFYQGHGDTALA